ncbi:uncharacterized protein NP_0080A [Natronomonas pharaonis DSM 2160]|uniref:Uncharacterized protein n=1 Tax=Natronomonas pharaonis (strain ATCC 35678 / DSM 2160 / CIP 103997 / JCM 8858 / NBRC 14720 / NCIMB 2260 / Gabara) TaxID=348780 RepID=A0A1U7ETB9_NATPD|nr:hypothetical protein [Natronomonas pharaonis]CAI48131.1 uncharacterized protein NP_0080A [Natronomonas pharaonis DSM 2160]
MASRVEFNATVSTMFGLFLFVVAVGNVVAGSTPFAIMFGALGFVFVSLSSYIRSNPDAFEDGDEEVPDRWIRIVRGGGGLVLLAAAAFVVALALG